MTLMMIVFLFVVVVVVVIGGCDADIVVEDQPMIAAIVSLWLLLLFGGRSL